MSRKRSLLVGWTLAVLAMALFTSLGRWQSQRAREKDAMLERAASVMVERVPRPLAAAGDPARTRDYDWAQGRGRFDAHGPLWLDNQQRDGRTGVRVYRIFLPEGAAPPMLVELGWRPLPADRRLPEVARPDGTVEVRGLLTPPPSPGLALGPALAAQDDGWLLTRIDLPAIASAAGLATPLAPRVLRLDPTLPMGYERDLTLLANTLPPEKHRGYAVQWFALAAAVLATALILTFRKARP